jgi:hypothetical protein
MELFNGTLCLGRSSNCSQNVPFLKRWNGAYWSAATTANCCNVFDLAQYDGVLVVLGYLGPGQARLASWDGTNWTADPFGIGSDVQVRRLVEYNGDLIVAGPFDEIGGVAALNIARWDGTNWRPLGSGVDGTVEALYSLGGVLYLGGTFTTAGGKPSHNIAAWTD